MNVKKITTTTILCALLFVSFSSFSQKEELKYEVGTSAAISSKSTLPFWLVANQNGIAPKKNGERIYFGINKDYTKESGWDWTTGFDAAFSSTYSNKYALINQYYLAFKKNKIQFFVGAKNPEVELDGLSFTNGNLIMSGNARPYPKIEIGSTDYLNIPFTKGWFGVKAVLSNGWLIDHRYASHVNLHHKNFFLRFGKDKGLSLEVGIDHYAQWAGTSPTYGKLEGGLKAFAKVFIAKNGQVLTTDNGDSSNNESDNSLGNHVGQNQAKLNYNSDKFSLTFFMKNMFEDKSGEIRKIYNVRDIYYGLHLKLHQKKIINSFLLEYYSSLNQGSVEITPSLSVIGFDSYFNNGIYRSGWSNFQKGFGIPLISPTTIGADNSIRFANTTVKAFNLGFTGQHRNLTYLFKATMYKNYGQVFPVVEDRSLPVGDWVILRKYTVDPQEYQKHFLLELLLPQNKIPFDIQASIAYDSGDIYKNSLGLMLKFSRSGFISDFLKK
ncbi:capsule assembly Wzi family protein [Ancylomarina sp.]|uniref:capsule assembly Wzi family protein n=1 Tax=Ancylomarina sp. TaxID=1970196 RepID=UPI0035678E38